MNRLIRLGQRIRQRMGRRALRVPPVPPFSSSVLRIQQLEQKVAEQEGRLDQLYLMGSGLLVAGCLLVLHKGKKGMYG